MVYVEHAVFRVPEDENQRIWRYMNFAKFASMLVDQSLFFSRVDQLGDPFEGSLTRASLRSHRASYGDMMVGAFAQALPSLRASLVNCWHMNDAESAAMWGLYAPRGAGIAIQSAFARLRDSLVSPPGENLFIGKVWYLDFESDDIRHMIPLNNSMYVIMAKQRSYEHERALRAMVANSTDEVAQKGRQMRCDLNQLVENIFVSPIAPAWFRSTVERVAKACGLERTVQHSHFDRSPLFY